MGTALALTLALILIPSVAHAQDSGDDDDDVLIRINGDVVIGPDETVSRVVVINGDVVVEGEVSDDVIVIEGVATISGEVGDNVTAISGDIVLTDSATVNNVNTISSDLERSSGATVNGDIHDQDDFGLPAWGIVLASIYFWLAATVIAVVSGLVFAAIGGTQLTRAATVMTRQFVNAVVGAVFLWIGVPLLAGLIFVTIVGIPLGILTLLFFLPVLWFLGYLVAGARLGGAILGRFGRPPSERPLAATALGVVLLQLVLLIPFVGWAIVVVAGLWGGGALAYTAFTAAGGQSFERAAATETGTAE